MVTLTITEPVPSRHSVAALEAASGLPLQRLRELIRNLVDVQRSLSGDEVTLSPGTMVGTLKIGGLRLDVRPRLTATDMVRLIRYAYGCGPEADARSEIELGEHGLDELLCSVLAEELDAIRRRGVSRLYVRRHEQLTALRGRLDFLGSFPWNEEGMTSVACRYHELSCDTLDNRIVSAALARAMMLEIAPETRRQINAHRHAWQELAAVRPITTEDIRKARRSYTRLTEHYRLTHHLCESLLSRLTPRSMFNAGAFATAGVSLNMAELFEWSVYRLLREQLEPAGFTVRYQTTDAQALRDGDGERYHSVRPDVLVFRDDVPIAVVDAKYKDYWEGEQGAQTPLRKVGNDDIYQLFFYASRLQHMHALPTPPAAIIVSPIPSAYEMGERVAISERFRTVRLHAGNVTHALSLVMMPLTEILHELAGGSAIRSEVNRMMSELRLI